ncbi:uncharacterized protein LOC129308958, partial [Prosopis cineraria]|uniref:uncharacterized protein LOC129308958 n=1 Tax=Prosopis cineraria TaxID=364024 RepID=UPI00240ED664
ISRKMSSRHRPLFACITSILAMADIASRKAQDLNGPLGSTFRATAKLAKFASPLIIIMKYQCLIIIFILDYQFLAAKKTIEIFWPSASRVFDKIEEIVVMIESLPEKFDDTVGKFPAMICQFTFSMRQWSLLHLISWLNWLVSTLNQMEQENSRMKEIAIDNRNIQLVSSESESLYTIESFCSAAQCFPAESYKDVEKILERIHDDESEREREREENKNIHRSGSIVKFKDTGKQVIRQEEEHPILQLFESKWLSH